MRIVVESPFTKIFYLDLSFQTSNLRKASNLQAENLDAKEKSAIWIRVSHCCLSRLDVKNVLSLPIQVAIDLRDFRTPPPPFLMREIHDLAPGPVKVISDEGHLLVQLVQGIALHASPNSSNLTSKLCSHFGHTTNAL